MAKIAFEDFDGGAINLISTADVLDYDSGGGTGGDVFGQVDGSSIGMPFDVADDTVADVSGGGTGSPFPNDSLGLAGQNTTAFFALNDADAVGINNATWTFDISSATSIDNIAIDLAAIGDFEASSSDGFKIEARIDSGEFQTIFLARTDESAFKDYRPLDGGAVFADDDPLALFIDGATTSTGFLDKADSTTGNFDTYMSTLLAGQSGSTLDIRVSYEGTPSGSEPMGIDNITINGTVATASFDLQITEIWSGQSGDDLTADWFEITNTGTTAWVSGVDPDLFYDDESQDAAAADLIQGITQLEPGDSAIVVIDNAAAVTDFINVWSPVIDLTGVEVGFVDGAGLGSGGDAVTLWVGDPTTTGVLADVEAYPAATSGVSYDVDLAAESVAGQNGAVETLALAGTSGTEPAVGSPGNGAPIAVTPTVDLVISEIMFNPASAESDWEWVELFNAGANAVDLSGYVIDDNNGTAVSSANIASGVIQAGETAILYNADAVSEADFTAAWGTGINLVAVTDWSALGLNNGGDTIGLWDSFASYSGDNQTQANALISVSYDGTLDDGAGSIYLTDLRDQNSFALSGDGVVTPAGDAYTSRAAGGNSGNDIGSPGGFVSNVDAPVPSDPDFFELKGSISGLSGAEITAFDPISNRLFVVDGGSTLQVFDLSDPANPTPLMPITLTGIANSIAVNNGVVAVAIEAAVATDPGTVAFFNTVDGALLSSVTVGSLPDMLTFTPDGTKILVANEGEPDAGIDPDGSISIIDLSGGINNLTSSDVSTADFTGFDADTLRAAGVRIFPGKSAAEDLEPEYIAVSEDNSTAFVTLQENNAIAVVDIATATVTDIQPLGTQDHSVPGNELDASDEDGIAGNLQTQPVQGLFQPDAIATFDINGQTYTITANEGDARDEDARISSLTLDPTAFPDAATLQLDENLGRLQVSTIDGDTDGDGDFDQLFSYGGRSFTIRDASGNTVFDSGNQLEAIAFANVSDPASLDGRSDNKGPEPEGLTVGVIDGRTYAFIGLERAEGVTVYDVTDPTAPTFVQFLTNAGDSEPEGLTFISAADSPTGENLLVVANEDSNTISIYGTEAPVAITPIYDIQGASQVSPFVLNGQTVADFFNTLPADTFSITGDDVVTTGVVTAIDTNGFYLQDPVGDGNIATSDGIFVFTGSGAPILNQLVVGNTVEVAATVAEFFPGDTDTRNLPTTQLTSPTVTVVPGPTVTVNPTIIGAGGRMPPNANIDDDAFATYDAVNDGIDFFESLEGMLVTAQDVKAVAGTNRFGEIFGVVDQGANASGLSQRGTLNISPDDFNPEKIQIDEDSGVFNFDFPDVNVGDLLGDVTGVVNYSFGNFEIIPTVDFTPNIVSAGLQPETTSLVGTADQLTIATYNVLNLDPIVEDPTKTEDGADDVDDDEGDGRFAAIANQIVNNLGSPDIIGLQEVQDNSGAEINDGITSASDTLQKLIDAIDLADDGLDNDSLNYEFIDNTFITEGESGGQPGGNIRTAFLYNPDRVSLVPGSVQTVGSQAPGEAFDGGRLPLVATFDFNGEEVTVVNNHFSSKGGSAPILGIEQDFAARQEDVSVNGSLDERQAQSAEVQTFVSNALATDPSANVVVLGDLNEFEFVSPVTGLESAGLTNLTNNIPEGERYSFIFQGNSQTLDHILVSDSLANNAEIDIVHTNSEFFVTDSLASDHDPVVTRLAFAPTVTATIFVDSNGTVVGNAFEAGQPYAGSLFSNTDAQFNTGELPDDVILGTSNADNIWGGLEGNDLIDGGTGNDTIGMSDGNVTVDAGAGNDFVYSAGSGAGTNVVELGAGDDNFWATAGDNTITGSDNNTIGLGTGNDTVTTLDGDDFVYTVNGGGGVNSLNLGDGTNTVYVENGDYDIITGTGNDSIGLGTGTDTVIAGDGNNIIYMVDPNGLGDGAKDILTGSGDDFIQTGSGNDIVDGGLGADTVQFAGTAADYVFLGTADNFTIQGTAIGTDTLKNIESLFFIGDNTVIETASILA
ncbi:endonuclease exonuclease phosphatase [Leptolyngbya sp. Heron Island J]|uniref:choice-of-anchor I family protein n=1 Tax=Leptolyngbya sp. Heron Island J TaxID=1385935 RepID=UPI0003B99A98|nr:choice-of-anchor I family protein [Leptolyngbya sp. Heron Island J]ESA36976.1 endonuclease exonuclease phosphatase [Leptolyngbya sp. Heron Island J]